MNSKRNKWHHCASQGKAIVSRGKLLANIINLHLSYSGNKRAVTTGSIVEKSPAIPRYLLIQRLEI